MLTELEAIVAYAEARLAEEEAAARKSCRRMATQAPCPLITGIRDKRSAIGTLPLTCRGVIITLYRP